MKKKFLRSLCLFLALSVPMVLTLLFSRQSSVSTAVPDNAEAAPESQAVSSVTAPPTVTSTASTAPPSRQPAAGLSEMRGVWIPYMSLQLNAEERTEQAFRQKISTMMDHCVQQGLNTVIVQVRPFGDAIYPSEYFPWSHIISGQQGKGVDFDPLEIIVQTAHERRLAVHAWINPFRISTGQTPDALSGNNPCMRWRKDDDPSNDLYTFTYQDGIYYNPAYPEVRRLIIDGVRELVTRYPLEGIQIDDYFYPSEEEGYDKKSYEAYCQTVTDGSTPLSLGEWRKNNVNMLIAGIYRTIHQSGSSVVFGIAPQCNFDNNEKLSADVLTWCRDNGYIDYLCPQLYVSMAHPVFPFRELADRWKETLSDSPVTLYFGLGLYKAGTDADGGTWQTDTDNIQEEINYLRQIGIAGYLLYSYDYLSHLKAESTQ